MEGAPVVGKAVGLVDGDWEGAALGRREGSCDGERVGV